MWPVGCRLDPPGLEGVGVVVEESGRHLGLRRGRRKGDGAPTLPRGAQGGAFWGTLAVEREMGEPGEEVKTVGTEVSSQDWESRGSWVPWASLSLTL